MVYNIERTPPTLFALSVKSVVDAKKPSGKQLYSRRYLNNVLPEEVNEHVKACRYCNRQRNPLFASVERGDFKLVELFYWQRPSLLTRYYKTSYNAIYLASHIDNDIDCEKIIKYLHRLNPRLIRSWFQQSINLIPPGSNEPQQAVIIHETPMSYVINAKKTNSVAIRVFNEIDPSLIRLSIAIYVGNSLGFITCLHMAASSKRIDVLKEIIKIDSSLANVKSSFGKKPIDYIGSEAINKEPNSIDRQMYDILERLTDRD